MNKNSEKLGTILIFIVAVFWGMFPILVNKGSAQMPPLFFAAISLFVGGMTAGTVSFLRGSLRQIWNKKVLFYGSIVAFMMSAFPYSFMFVGSELTSGLNTSALLLSEILFTLLITPFFGEKSTLYKILGGLLVLTGAFLILFKGGNVNVGDILIFLSTITLPFGNYFAKKALRIVSGENLLIIRYTVAGFLILVASFFIEDASLYLPSVQNFWPYIVISGGLLLGLVNIIWYAGLKHLEISKAVNIMMTFPFFSLIFLILFYDEKPSTVQVIGLVIIVLGGYLSVKVSKNSKVASSNPAHP